MDAIQQYSTLAALGLLEGAKAGVFQGGGASTLTDVDLSHIMYTINDLQGSYGEYDARPRFDAITGKVTTSIEEATTSRAYFRCTYQLGANLPIGTEQTICFRGPAFLKGAKINWVYADGAGQCMWRVRSNDDNTPILYSDEACTQVLPYTINGNGLRMPEVFWMKAFVPEGTDYGSGEWVDTDGELAGYSLLGVELNYNLKSLQQYFN